MEGLETYLRNHPEQVAMSEAAQRNVPPPTSNQRVESIVTVPVVFHIVGSAARQAQVTDADVVWQLNKMNEDYSGANADSTNAAYGFYPIRAYNGYCQIRYCLAQRNGLDLPANGIDRVVSTLTGTQNCNDVNTQGNATLVKHAASGGADAWDPTRFLNIWVGEFGPCLLGIATFPGTGAANEQGVVVSYEGFSNNPAYVDPAFALGRTAVHESGHYWGLLHIWGDESGCTNSDFRQIGGSTCVYPANLGGSATDQSIGDTPNQGAQTTNCPSGARTDACTGSAPGINYQNYMDYTEDACYSMFTLKQVDRMQYTLDNCRASLKTSNGCVPPVIVPGNDARISAIINPAAGANLGCSSVTPVVTISNAAANTLTSAKINAILDGNTVLTGGYPVSWTGSLTTGLSANVTLPPITVGAIGSHTLKVFTSLPNGAADANTANDTSTVTFNRIAPSAIPVSNTFETAFLPAGWASRNPDNDDLSWFRFNPAGGASGGSVYAAVIDNYDFDHPGTFDDIVTPIVNTTAFLANDSLLYSFDLAYKNYPDPGFYDSLKVLVTNDCGATWTTIWARGGPGLATAGASDQLYNPPAQGDWKNIKVAIGQNIFGAGAVQFALRNVNNFGNVIWIDNINVDLKPRKDMQTTAILRPRLTECASSFSPSITVRNGGGETVTGFKTGYILNGGAPIIQTQNISLVSGASTTISFPAITAPVGTNTIKLFVADPLTASVGPDGTPGNDTLTRTFLVPQTAASVVEGFEGPTFAPANWSLINPNNNVTWTQKTPGKNSTYSAFIDNYNNNTVGQHDGLQSPPLNTVGADSVIVSFDLAHKNYDDGTVQAFDSLRVLVSTNCGTSYSVVYNKSGSALATAGSSDQDYTTPINSDWRRETVRLGGAFTGGSLLVQFENTSDYGNNVFLDNINISPVFKRDIQVVSVSPLLACNPTFAPVVTVQNKGTEAVTAFNLSYTIGNNPALTQNVTGINLAPGATTTVTLPNGTLAAGLNNIKVYSYAPTTASGTGDQYLLNDTLLRTTALAGQVQAPTNISETFEGTFLPTGWALTNPDNSLTWQRASVGRSSTGSAFVRNFIYFNNSGQRDGLYTPVLNFTGVDSIKLSFDLSAATRDSAKAGFPQDTLEVLVTKDCGNTFTSVYKKWGRQLQTISTDPTHDYSYIQTVEYAPNGSYLWRTENVDLSSIGGNGPLQVVFRNSTNNGNDIYVDNVNVKTVTLPPRLKSEGVIAMPNPFSEQFNLWFVSTPTDLRYISVFNSVGQLMYKKQFNGAPSNIVPVDLRGKAAGIYVVHIGYADKSKDKEIRIMKSNE